MASLDHHHHIVRRGVEAAHQVGALVDRSKTAAGGAHDGKGLADDISAVTAAILIGGLVLLAGVMFTIHYSYGMVVPTLASVEDSNQDQYTRLNTAADAEEATPDKKTASTAPAAPAASVDLPPAYQAMPITRSLHSTMQHLRAAGGRFSRFRGLSIFIVYNLLNFVFVSAAFTFGIAGRFVWLDAGVKILAEVLTTHLVVTWVHTVIAMPTSQPWWRRVPAPRTFSKAMPAVALKAAASQVGFVLPAILGGVFKVASAEEVLTAFRSGPEHYQPPQGQFGMSLAMLALSLATFVLLEVPATVTMVRVAASLLPDEVETIVPFDRTFGDKFTPAILGGSGVIGIADAWRTFDRPARFRLLRLLTRVFAMFAAVIITFVSVYATVVMLAANGKI